MSVRISTTSPARAWRGRGCAAGSCQAAAGGDPDLSIGAAEAAITELCQHHHDLALSQADTGLHLGPRQGRGQAEARHTGGGVAGGKDMDGSNMLGRGLGAFDQDGQRHLATILGRGRGSQVNPAFRCLGIAHRLANGAGQGILLRQGGPGQRQQGEGGAPVHQPNMSRVIEAYQLSA